MKFCKQMDVRWYSLYLASQVCRSFSHSLLLPSCWVHFYPSWYTTLANHQAIDILLYRPDKNNKI